MAFEDPPGDYHIKYGMIAGDDVFVIKVAGGFYGNPRKYNIPAIQGLMIVLCAKTGQPLYLLEDEGYLTNLRTAIAGLISAKYLAPRSLLSIGVIGTGQQARMQVEILKHWTSCRSVWVLGRNPESVNRYKQDMEEIGFKVKVAGSSAVIAENCNLIITATPASTPLLYERDLRPGTHITALGADSPGKQELDPQIFKRADICVVDSKNQCIDHGETHLAVKQGIFDETDLIELGEIVNEPKLGRKDEHQITLADLTGLATQDIQIAKSIVLNEGKG